MGIELSSTTYYSNLKVVSHLLQPSTLSEIWNYDLINPIKEFLTIVDNDEIHLLYFYGKFVPEIISNLSFKTQKYIYPTEIFLNNKILYETNSIEYSDPKIITEYGILTFKIEGDIVDLLVEDWILEHSYSSHPNYQLLSFTTNDRAKFEINEKESDEGDICLLSERNSFIMSQLQIDVIREIIKWFLVPTIIYVKKLNKTINEEFIISSFFKTFEANCNYFITEPYPFDTTFDYSQNTLSLCDIECIFASSLLFAVKPFLVNENFSNFCDFYYNLSTQPISTCNRFCVEIKLKAEKSMILPFPSVESICSYVYYPYYHYKGTFRVNGLWIPISRLLPDLVSYIPDSLCIIPTNQIFLLYNYFELMKYCNGTPRLLISSRSESGKKTAFEFYRVKTSSKEELLKLKMNKFATPISIWNQITSKYTIKTEASNRIDFSSEKPCIIYLEDVNMLNPFNGSLDMLHEIFTFEGWNSNSSLKRQYLTSLKYIITGNLTSENIREYGYKPLLYLDIDEFDDKTLRLILEKYIHVLVGRNVDFFQKLLDDSNNYINAILSVYNHFITNSMIEKIKVPYFISIERLKSVFKNMVLLKYVQPPNSLALTQSCIIFILDSFGFFFTSFQKVTFFLDKVDDFTYTYLSKSIDDILPEFSPSFSDDLQLFNLGYTIEKSKFEPYFSYSKLYLHYEEKCNEYNFSKISPLDLKYFSETIKKLQSSSNALVLIYNNGIDIKSLEVLLSSYFNINFKIIKADNDYEKWKNSFFQILTSCYSRSEEFLFLWDFSANITKVEIIQDLLNLLTDTPLSWLYNVEYKEIILSIYNKNKGLVKTQATNFNQLLNEFYDTTLQKIKKIILLNSIERYIELQLNNESLKSKQTLIIYPKLDYNYLYTISSLKLQELSVNPKLHEKICKAMTKIFMYLLNNPNEYLHTNRDSYINCINIFKYFFNEIYSKQQLSFKNLTKILSSYDEISNNLAKQKAQYISSMRVLNQYKYEYSEICRNYESTKTIYENIKGSKHDIEMKYQEIDAETAKIMKDLNVVMYPMISFISNKTEILLAAVDEEWNDIISQNPVPEEILMIMACFLSLFEQKDFKNWDYVIIWELVKDLVLNNTITEKLRKYNVNDLSSNVIEFVSQQFLILPLFDPKVEMKSNLSLIRHIKEWILAIYQYCEFYKENRVQFDLLNNLKKEKLPLENKLKMVESQLNVKKDEYQKQLEEYTTVKNVYEEKEEEAKKYENVYNMNSAFYVKYNSHVSSLQQLLQDLAQNNSILPGNILIASSILNYLVSYPIEERVGMIDKIEQICSDLEINFSHNFDVISLLNAEEYLSEWSVNGIPTETNYNYNMIRMNSFEYWPCFYDPIGFIYKSILKQKKKNNVFLSIYPFQDLQRIITEYIAIPSTIIIKNPSNNLEQILLPLLIKTYEFIDNVITYNNENIKVNKKFFLYFWIDNPNWKIPNWMKNKIDFINFMFNGDTLNKILQGSVYSLSKNTKFQEILIENKEAIDLQVNRKKSLNQLLEKCRNLPESFMEDTVFMSSFMDKLKEYKEIVNLSTKKMKEDVERDIKIYNEIISKLSPILIKTYQLKNQLKNIYISLEIVIKMLIKMLCDIDVKSVDLKTILKKFFHLLLVYVSERVSQENFFTFSMDLLDILESKEEKFSNFQFILQNYNKTQSCKESFFSDIQVKMLQKLSNYFFFKNIVLQIKENEENWIKLLENTLIYNNLPNPYSSYSPVLKFVLSHILQPHLMIENFGQYILECLGSPVDFLSSVTKHESMLMSAHTEPVILLYEGYESIIELIKYLSVKNSKKLMFYSLNTPHGHYYSNWNVYTDGADFKKLFFNKHSNYKKLDKSKTVFYLLPMNKLKKCVKYDQLLSSAQCYYIDLNYSIKNHLLYIYNKNIASIKKENSELLQYYFNNALFYAMLTSKLILNNSKNIPNNYQYILSLYFLKSMTNNSNESNILTIYKNLYFMFEKEGFDNSLLHVILGILNSIRLQKYSYEDKIEELTNMLCLKAEQTQKVDWGINPLLKLEKIDKKKEVNIIEANESNYPMIFSEIKFENNKKYMNYYIQELWARFKSYLDSEIYLNNVLLRNSSISNEKNYYISTILYKYKNENVQQFLKFIEELLSYITSIVTRREKFFQIDLYLIQYPYPFLESLKFTYCVLNSINIFESKYVAIFTDSDEIEGFSINPLEIVNGEWDKENELLKYSNVFNTPAKYTPRIKLVVVKGNEEIPKIIPVQSEILEKITIPVYYKIIGRPVLYFNVPYIKNEIIEYNSPYFLFK